MEVSDARGLRWRAMLQDHMARRTCFREQYYTGTRRYISGREECRKYQSETIYKFVMVSHQYLWMHVFVWARVFCGTRKYQYASVDCSGVIRKIHMREYRWRKDSYHDRLLIYNAFLVPVIASECCWVLVNATGFQWVLVSARKSQWLQMWASEFQWVPVSAS